MKKLLDAASAYIWKLRYAREFHRRTKLEWYLCWQSADAMLNDCFDGNVSEMTPDDAVSEELSNWND
ncbi:MAG: hypothetical protein DRR42_09825 [Gammaproteobacteria bacterium]|nr:MAG: hypothetical protein DRR42_09825 [Gammaproteobacteria bacterium]